MSKSLVARANARKKSKVRIVRVVYGTEQFEMDRLVVVYRVVLHWKQADTNFGYREVHEDYQDYASSFERGHGHRNNQW